jgi:hypothetical protein
VPLEDQAATVTTFGEHFSQRRTDAAFFYTRCGNPAKCSATVTRLAELAADSPRSCRMRQSVWLASATTPFNHNPQRLAAYGAARGMPFSDLVHRVQPTLVVEVSANRAMDRGRWRHLTRHERTRPDLEPRSIVAAE